MPVTVHDGQAEPWDDRKTHPLGAVPTDQDHLAELREDYRKVTGRICLLSREQHTRQVISEEAATAEEAQRVHAARTRQQTQQAGGSATLGQPNRDRGGPSLG